MSSSYEYVIDDADLDGLSATILIDVEPGVSDDGKDADSHSHLHSSQVNSHHHLPHHHSSHYYGHCTTGRGGMHGATRSDAGSSRRSSRKSGTGSNSSTRARRRLRQWAEVGGGGVFYTHNGGAEWTNYPSHFGSSNKSTHGNKLSGRSAVRQAPVFTSTYVIDDYHSRAHHDEGDESCTVGVSCGECVARPRRSTRCANLRGTRSHVHNSSYSSGRGGTVGMRLRTRAADSRRMSRHTNDSAYKEEEDDDEDVDSDDDDEATETVMYTVQDVCSDSDKDDSKADPQGVSGNTTASQPSSSTRGAAAASYGYNKRLRKKLQRRQRQHNAEMELGVSAAVEALASRPSSHTTPHYNVTQACQATHSAAPGVSQYFISPIHQSVAEASTPWAGQDTRYAFLGQGGLSQAPTTAQSQATLARKDITSATHSLAQLVRRSETSNGVSEKMTTSVAHRLGGKRRSEGSYYYCVGYCSSSSEDDDDVSSSSSSSSDVCCNGCEGDNEEEGVKRKRRGKANAGSEVMQVPAVFLEVVRPRKRRRLARRRMTEECGGSLVLRPLPCPSITPPGTSLPSSSADVREDLLASSLMNMTLQEDDFKLC